VAGSQQVARLDQRRDQEPQSEWSVTAAAERELNGKQSRHWLPWEAQEPYAIDWSAQSCRSAEQLDSLGAVDDEHEPVAAVPHARPKPLDELDALEAKKREKLDARTCWSEQKSADIFAKLISDGVAGVALKLLDGQQYTYFFNLFYLLGQLAPNKTIWSPQSQIGLQSWQLFSRKWAEEYLWITRPGVCALAGTRHGSLLFTVAEWVRFVHHVQRALV